MKKKKYRIAASLEYGKIYSNVIEIIVLIGIISGLFCVPAMIVASVQEKMPELIWCIFFCAFCLVCFVYVYICFRFTRRSISLALKDAVELKGEAIRTDKKGNKTNIYWDTAFLTVKFLLDGENYKKVSVKPSFKRPFIGYNKAFKKFEGKTIRILYSKSQDHVLIIKDKISK